MVMSVSPAVSALLLVTLLAAASVAAGASPGGESGTANANTAPEEEPRGAGGNEQGRGDPQPTPRTDRRSVNIYPNGRIVRSAHARQEEEARSAGGDGQREGPQPMVHRAGKSARTTDVVLERDAGDASTSAAGDVNARTSVPAQLDDSDFQPLDQNKSPEENARASSEKAFDNDDQVDFMQLKTRVGKNQRTSACATQYVLQGPMCSQACVDKEVDELVHGVHGFCSDAGFVEMVGELNVKVFVADSSRAPDQETPDPFFDGPYCNPHSVLKGVACEVFCLPEAQWAVSHAEHIENLSRERCEPQGYNKLVGTKTVTLHARHHSDTEEAEAADAGNDKLGHEGDPPKPNASTPAVLVDLSNNALEAKRAAQAALAAAGGTKYIGGVPIYHYRHAHPSGMHPSALELAEQRSWVLKLPENFTDEQARSFCAHRTGNAKCTLEARPSEGWPFVAIQATESELEQHLRTHGGVEFGEPDQILEPIPEIPEDQTKPFAAAALGGVTHGLDRIDNKNVELDQDYSGGGPNGGAGVHVYVFDTGVRTTHQEFGGRAVGDLDDAGHGTHCAGTIGGATWGVAKKATIHSVKVCYTPGGCSMSKAASTMYQLSQDHGPGGKYAGKPAVLSFSLGGQGWCGRSTLNAYAKLTALGITAVASAGNSNLDACGFSPANCPGFVTVGSVYTVKKDKYFDMRSSYSNWGRCVDIWAPGDAIDSAAHDSDQGSLKLSGTSMAGPHVAGVLAVLAGQGHTDPNAAKQEPYKGYSAAAKQLFKTATAGKVKDAVQGHQLNDRLLYIAPTSEARRRRSGWGGGGGGGKPPWKPPCFGREASFAYASPSAAGPWRKRRMVELKAGDYVLALDDTTGVPFPDRVFTNLHLEDTSRHPLLEIRHTLGSVTVTPDHVLFLDGGFRAARLALPGSSMVTVPLRRAARGQSGITNVTVLSVVPGFGRIVNPLTHSGLILVATAEGDAGVGLLATTVLESPRNAMLDMARMPGLCKGASLMFPEAFQASFLTEWAILLVANAAAGLPPLLGFFAFVVVDFLAGSCFILWSSGALLVAGAAYVAIRSGRFENSIGKAA